MEKMDAQLLLDELIAKGKALAEKGSDLAEQKLDLPEPGPARDAMLSKLSKGAAVAGVLAIMLGTKGGRAITGGVLKLGSLAAVGGLAYNAFQGWKANNPNFVGKEEKPVEELEGEQAQTRGKLLLRSMVSAANIDGHIGIEEQQKIHDLADKLGLDDDVINSINMELLNAETIAVDVQSMQVAAEVYLSSLVVLDKSVQEDSEYLARLADLLNLPEDLVASIETQSQSLTG